jgi:membrane protein
MLGHSWEAEPVTAKSVWDLIKGTASSWSEINAPRLGAALAFYTMLSTAPLVILCIAIAGLAFSRDAAQGQVVAQIQSVVGSEGAIAIQGLLQHASRPGASYLAAALGFLVLLWSASGVFGELRDALNLIWGVKSTSGSGLVGVVKYRFFSFTMVLAIGFLLLVSLLLSAAVAAVSKYVGGALPLPAVVLHVGNILLSFVSITVLFALIYRFVPDVHIEWEDVWIGAAATSLVFSLGKFLIGLYLGREGVASAYGAASSLVVFIIWVYYSAQIFYLGAEFTHAFAERHGSRAGRRSRPLTPAEAEVERFRERKLA